MPSGKKITPTPFSRVVPPEEMSLKQLLDETVRGLKLDFNCHAIAKIQTFNAAKQTCTALINYKKTFLKKNSKGLYEDEYVDYPLLLDVPVIIMSGGNAALTFPISAGDDCLILFNDRDIDNWFATGQSLPLNSNRLHSLNDGMALVGLRASNNPIASYDQSRVVLRNNTASVGVNSNAIQIKNSSQNLKSILQDLVDAINGIITSGGQTVSPASQAALNLIKTRIGSLLE
jgi:hypothetical protein